MIPLSSFLPYISTEVPGCPIPMMEDAVREACRVFSLDSWSVTEDMSLTVTAGVMSFPLVPLDAANEVLTVSTVVLDGSQVLSPGRGGAVHRFVPLQGCPAKYWVHRGQLSLFPVPDRDYAVQLEAVIRPTLTATEVDDRYFEMRDVVVRQALSILLLPRSPWTDVERARVCLMEYNALVALYSMRDDTGDVGAERRVSPGG